MLKKSCYLSVILIMAALCMGLFSKADSYDKEGWKLLENGDYRGSLKQFDQALQIKSEHKHALTGKKIAAKILSLKKKITKTKTQMALTKAEAALLKRNKTKGMSKMKMQLEEEKKLKEKYKASLEKLKNNTGRFNSELIKKAREVKETKSQLGETKRKLARVMQKYAEVQSRIAGIQTSLARTTQQIRKEKDLQIESLKKDYEKRMSGQMDKISKFDGIQRENQRLKIKVAELEQKQKNMVVRTGPVGTPSKPVGGIAKKKASTKPAEKKVKPSPTPVVSKVSDIDAMFMNAIKELEDMEISTLNLEKNLKK